MLYLEEIDTVKGLFQAVKQLFKLKPLTLTYSFPYNYSQFPSTEFDLPYFKAANLIKTSIFSSL